MRDQTEEIALAAIGKNAFAARFVDPKLITPEFRTKAVDENPSSIRFLGENLTEHWIEAIRDDIRYYLDVPNHLRTPEFNKQAIEAVHLVLQYMRDQTPELCNLAVKLNPATWKFAVFQPMDLIETVYDYDPRLVTEHTNHHTSEYYVAVCKDDPRYAAFIDKEDLQLLAIRRNVDCLIFINNPSKAVVEESLKIDPTTIMYFEQTPEMQLQAVMQNPSVICYCVNPFFELCKLAVKNHPILLNVISDVTMENLLFPPNKPDMTMSVPVSDDLSKRIDKATSDKIPDTKSLSSLSLEIIQSGASVEEKSKLLQKLFQF